MATLTIFTMATCTIRTAIEWTSIIEVNAVNPEKCTPGHDCSGHDKTHVHGANCGHEAVPHGDHVDYLVGGHLHHSHGGHCDDHGKLQVAIGTSSQGATH